MKKTLFILCALIAGISVAAFRIADIDNNSAFFHNGSWTGGTDLPLGKDNLLTAQVTVFALFALPSEEAVYLFARQDNDRNAFNSASDYIITGNIRQINARYWSITCYGKDLFLVPNSEERFSFNNTNITTDSAGNFKIVVSHQKQPGNWLPAPHNTPFTLVLRIYGGDKDFLTHLASSPLPAISIKRGP